MEKLQTKEGVREIQEIMSRSNAADKKRIGEILVDHFTNHGLTFLEEEDEECEDPEQGYKPMKYTYKAVATVDVYLDKEEVSRLHSEYGGDFEDFFNNEFCMSAEEFDNVTYSYQLRPMTDKEIEDHIEEEDEDEY